MSKVLNIDGINGTSTDGIELSVNNTRRLFINSSGHVAVGSSDFANKSSSYNKVLSVTGTDSALVLQSTYNTGSTWSIQSYNGYLAFLNGNDNTNTERLRIDSSGRIGIGATNPQKELQINATEPTIRLEESSGGSKRLELSVNSNAEAKVFANQSGGTLILGTVGAERLRIDSSGNILIGTTSSVVGLLQISDGTIRDVSGYFANSTAYQGTTTNHSIAFLTNNATRLTIDSSGNVGIGTPTTNDAGVTITKSVTRDNGWDAKLALQSTASGDYPALLFSGCSSTTRSGAIVQTTSTSGNGAASLITAQIDFPNTSSTEGEIRFSTNSNIGITNVAERLRIDSSGNIGIGTASPSSKLHISGASGIASELRIACTTANNGGKISFYESTSAAFEIANTSANGDLYIKDTYNNSERFRISNTGFIGIGTSSPGQILDVNGNLEVRGWTYMDSNYGHSIVGLYAANRIQSVWMMGNSYKIPAAGTSITGAYGIGWSHPNADAATGVTTRLTNHGAMIIINGVVTTALSDSIYCSGNITAYSDERVKTNWRNLTNNFVEKLARVKSGIFDRIDFENGNPNKTQVGVSAQSLREILPEAIIEGKDEAKSLSVSYGNAALAACVELAKEIINLKEQHKKEILELKSLIQSKV